MRYLYLPSAGFALAFSSGICSVLNNRTKHRLASFSPRWPVLFVVLSLTATLDQTRWWDRAGRLCEQVIHQVERRSNEQDATLYVFNIPRRIHGAYVFHNGFESAIRLHGLDDGNKIYDGERFLERNDGIPASADVFRLSNDQ